MDIKKFAPVKNVVGLGGFMQVALVSIVGIAVAYIWFDFKTAAYLGFAFSFGSTMLVVKMLQDTRKLESMPGRIVLGILLIQDIVAIIALSLIPLGSFNLSLIIGTVVDTAGFIMIVVIGFGRYVFPWIFDKIEDSEEMLLLSAISTCLLMGLFCISQGLSLSIGAFLTGVALANLPSRIELIAKAKPLRDFFTSIFFVSVGMQIVLPDSKIIVPAVVLTLACLTAKPLITAWLVSAFHFPKRVAFNAGNFLIPISEFGLVIVNLGIHSGHIKPEVLTFTIIVMTATMLISSYMTKDKYANWLYKKAEPLGKLAFKTTIEQELTCVEDGFEAVLVGCKRFGSPVLDEIEKRYETVVIDFNPDVYKVLNERGKNVILGDARESTPWECIGDLRKVKLIFCTVTSRDFLEGCVPFFRKKCPNAFLIISSNEQDLTRDLYEQNQGENSRMYILCSSTVLGGQIKEGKMPHLFNPEGNDLGEVRLKDLKHLIQTIETWKPGSCSAIRALTEPLSN